MLACDLLALDARRKLVTFVYMGRGVLPYLRARRGLFSVLISLALLVPILANLLPVHAGHHQVAQANMAGMEHCQSGSTHHGGKDMPGSHDMCCVLCVVGTPPVGPVRLGGGLDIVEPPRISGPIVVIAAISHPQRRLLFREIIPRGPPDLLVI